MGRRFDYPEPVDHRTGCKVSWNYYATEQDALKASEVAKAEGQYQLGQGYDFGYCWPGTIYGPEQQNWKPGLWEVCIP